MQGAATTADITAQATVRAEFCLALVGGIYLDWGGAEGGLNTVRQWLDQHWRRSCLELASNSHRQNMKSVLQELTQAQKLACRSKPPQKRKKAMATPTVSAPG